MADGTTGVRVLFTGEYWPGANSLYIARAFERCGAVVRILNDYNLFPEWAGVAGRAVRRLLHQTLIEPEWNAQLLKLVATFQPDLVYITNAHLCYPQTLQAIRAQSIPVMGFYHDVQWHNLRGSRFFEDIPYFDLIATTRRWQEPEFKAAGAKAVSVVRFGYDRQAHRPLQVSQQADQRYGADVTFIGTFEPHRAAELTSLVSGGFLHRFRLWGGYWDRLPPDSPLRQFWQGRLVQEQEIPVIYAASKVALHWVGWEPLGTDAALKKGDQHNSRTFQIAACGGAIMMAQRTEEHVRLFAEDVEAVFFDKVDDLREKLAYWLAPARDEARRRMAVAARARCLAEDYSYTPVVRSWLEYFGLPVIRPL